MNLGYLLCVTKRWLKKALCCLNPVLLSNSLNCRRTDSASGPVPSQRHCCLPSSCTLRRPDPVRLPPRPGRNLISILDPTSEPAACSIKNIQVNFNLPLVFESSGYTYKPKAFNINCHALDTCHSGHETRRVLYYIQRMRIMSRYARSYRLRMD